MEKYRVEVMYATLRNCVNQCMVIEAHSMGEAVTHGHKAVMKGYPRRGFMSLTVSLVSPHVVPAQ